MVNEAYQERVEAIDRRNAALNRKLHFSKGDYVWVQQEAVLGRVYKMDAHYTGPWQLMEAMGSSCENGTPTVTWLCRQHGRRVKL